MLIDLQMFLLLYNFVIALFVEIIYIYLINN